MVGVNKLLPVEIYGNCSDCSIYKIWKREAKKFYNDEPITINLRGEEMDYHCRAQEWGNENLDKPPCIKPLILNLLTKILEK